jgi:hypothetical protein
LVGDRVEDRPSLKDLDGVRVAVEEPLPRGLSRDTLKQSVESQLRAAGIKVLGLGDFPTGDPHLRVTISASAERNQLVAVDVQLDFVQIVFLRRNPQVTFNRAQTWKADAQVTLLAAAQLAREAQRELARQIDQFIADYRAVNA